MVTATTKPAAHPATKSAIWIYNPGLDLIVGCGAWSAPLLLLTYWAAGSSTLAWSVAFYGLALFFNYPHYMATIYRAYHTEEDFNKYRIFTVHITGLILLTLLLSHFWFNALPWIFTLYITWSPWHYSGQNYGLFMMFARRAGSNPSPAGRRALYSAFLLSYAILFLSFHTGPSTDPLFLSMGIPGRISSIALVPLAIGFVACASFGISQLAGQVGWRPLLPSLTLFSTQFLWFLLPTVLSLGEGLRVPQTRYSTGVLAVMHSAQYLWITSYYAQREATQKGSSQWRPYAYFAVLIAGGIALFIPGPWLASGIFHSDFTSSFLIFTALVNIHHFILDGAIWKLRDGRIAALLLNSQDRVTEATSQAGSRLAAVARWLVGNSSAARNLRYGTALLLLAWGTVDQVRYYFVLHGENLADLQRAAALDSYDSSLQTRLGRKEMEAGQTENAIAAWRQGVKANPSDAAPRNALLQYLTSQKRFTEAYQLTSQSLRYTPKDADLLVNHGILANQFGHADEAADSWKKAIAADPSQSYAHLYLAGELEREGKSAAAIPHYMIFLEQMSQASTQERPPAASLIAIVLRLAQCQTQANQPKQAEQAYELAQRMAGQTGEKRLEAIAAVGAAELQASQGRPAESLRLYQKALRLDDQVSDPRSAATDWYGYGLFLRDSGLSDRMAYASLLKSESLMKPLGETPELQSITQARESMEKKLNGQGSGIRRNLEATLSQALTFTVQP